MLWDGFGFFAFNDMKINRKKERIHHRFGSGCHICINLIVLIISLYVIWLYSLTYGQLKLQETKSELVVDSLKANSTSNLRLMGVLKAKNSNLFPKFGIRKKNYLEMTEDENLHIQTKVCNGTQFVYEQTNIQNLTKNGTLITDKNSTVFKASCYMSRDPLGLTTNFLYYMAVGPNINKFKGYFKHSQLNEKGQTIYVYQSQTNDSLKEIEFQTLSTFRGQLRIDVDPDLFTGVDLSATIYHSEQAEDQSLYNNWKFNSPENWYQFHNFLNTPLVQGQDIKVGTETNMESLVEVKIKTAIKKDKNVEKRVLGVPIQYSDGIDKSIQFVRNLKNCERSTKILGKERVKGKATDSFLKMDLEIDFNQQVTTLWYVSILDIISEVGGLKAAFLPLLVIFSPFLALKFMLKLAQVIKARTLEHYGRELDRTLDLYICKL